MREWLDTATTVAVILTRKRRANKVKRQCFTYKIKALESNTNITKLCRQKYVHTDEADWIKHQDDTLQLLQNFLLQNITNARQKAWNEPI